MAQTYTDNNVNQLIINKLTKSEYDGLQQVSENELWLVEEQVDSTVTQGSTNPVQSGAVYEALQDIGGNINDGTTTFTKNNETIGTTSANQSVNQTIKLPNDVVMCKMSDGIVYDSYITYTKIKQYLPDYPYYSDDLNWEIGGNPPMRASITEGDYYLDVDTNHIFVADENLELLDVTSTVVVQGDINKLYCDVDTNILYRYDGTDFVLINAKPNEIVDSLIIAIDDDNRHWYAYPTDGTCIGYVVSTGGPVKFYDRKAHDYHAFTSADIGKYFYDDIDKKVYMCFQGLNELYLDCISDMGIYYLENLDTTKTYISYDTSKIYRTNDGTEFKLIATNSYNDLNNKPLSVENNKVKYTLSDGTTKLTLAQENDVKDIPISFTPDTSIIGGNLLSGDTLSQMAVKLNAFLYSVKAFKLTFNDYTRHLAVIDVTDWYVNNSQTNYSYYIIGTCNILRTVGFTDPCSSYNISAVVNWNRNNNLRYSKNNGYSVNIISYNNRYYIALSRTHESAATLFFNGIFNNILTSPLQLKDSDVTVIYQGTEY